MISRSRLLRVLFFVVAALSTFAPQPAHADTLCEDGWISPSDGGPGTCSWHGGIAGNDNDYGGGDYDYGGGDYDYGGGDWEGLKDPDSNNFENLLVWGALGAGVVWLVRNGDNNRKNKK